jgi:lipoprotein-releasing system permease protein
MTIGIILRFAWRYFRAKKSTHAINIISWVSVTAITFGTAALITIFSAFNGFESLVKSLYATFYPDLRISSMKGKTILISADQIQALKKVNGVSGISMIVEEKSLLQNGSLQSVVTIKGVDKNYAKISGVDSSIYHGVYETGNLDRPGLVMGIGVEQSLGLQADRSIYPLTVYLPRKGTNPVSDPLSAVSSAIAYPQGSFAIQSEFDNKYVLTDLDFVKNYMQYKTDEYSAIEVKTDQGADLKQVKENMDKILGNTSLIEDRYEQNRTLYSTINLEKWAIYAIFTLILVVAAFNIVGSLSMLVLEKKKDIQVLKSMGATDPLIQKIFLAEGVFIGLLGTLTGMLISLFVYYLQTRYKLIPLEGATFLIDYYPLKLLVSDFVLVGSTVFIIAMGSAWIPARRAAQEVMELRN